MRYFLLIFALLIASCDDNEPRFCSNVIISDASPIQFWLVDCDTYNEKEVCGVHPKCWCHPWNCDEDLVVQFKDSPNGIFSLMFTTEDSIDYVVGEFEENILSDSESVYNITYSPSGSPDSCYGKVQFKIIEEQLAQPLLNNSFDDGLDNWLQESTGDTWEVFSPGTIQAINVSKLIYQRAPLQDASYNLTVVGSFTSVSFGTINLIYTIRDKNGNTIISGTVKTSATIGVWTQVITFNGSGAYEIGLRATGTFLGQTNLRSVTLSTDSTVLLGFAKSDCIDIQDSHDCTLAIEYSNNRNFSGLIYETASPELTFKTRVPAIFFHDKFPEEDEAMELTTGIQKTSGFLKSQRLFETDYMPYYMHKKLKLIFMHQTILIDNLYWLKEEAYEIADGDRRWPVKKGKVFLTSRDDVNRATL